MRLDVPCKILPLECSEELKYFDYSSITKNLWIKDTFSNTPVAKTFQEVEVLNIYNYPLKYWNSGLDNLKNNNPVPVNTNNPIFKLINIEIDKLKIYYNATVKKAILSGLSSKSLIPYHFDKGDIFEYCHRVHLPLVTDPNAKFYIEENTYYFEPYKFVEFDNRRFHSVVNNSEIFRIHLIVDLLPNSA